MKTMVLSDLLSLKPALFQIAWVAVIVDAVMLVCMQSAEAALAGIVVMVPYIVFFTLAVGDETSGWDRMRLTLPVGRGVLVRSRYASVVLVALATFAIMLVANTLFVGIIGMIPQLSGWLGGMALTGDSVVNMLGSGVFAIAMCMLFCAFTIPPVFRFGITRATRFIPVLGVLGLLVAFAALSDSTGVSLDVLDAMSPLVVVGVPVVVSAAICAASIAVATRMLERREF